MKNDYYSAKEKEYLKKKYGFTVPDNFKPKSLRERMLEEGKMYAEINKRDSKKNNNSN